MPLLHKVSKKMKLIMGGYHDGDETWFTMAKLFTADCKHQYKLIPAEPVESYYKMYKHADVCLVPLVNSRFNSMKSNLKILEAANLGLPVIASKVNPYLDMPVTYCRSTKDWIHAIKKFIHYPNRIKVEGEELRKFCDENYNFYKINEQRKQILFNEAGKQSKTRRDAPPSHDAGAGAVHEGA
jgi:glycosyltransferase involved in cell wall biosynthesis